MSTEWGTTNDDSGDFTSHRGDGVCEYLLCTQQGNLLAFSSDGEILYNHQFDNRTINMTAAFGDLVPATPGIEFAVTGGESGRMFCFSTSAPQDQSAPWRTYRADNGLTGAWFGLRASTAASMYPENLDWDSVLSGGNLAMFEAFNEVAPVWCPSFYMLSEGSPEVEFLKSSGKTLWSYDCAHYYARPIGANTKTINIVAQYRMAAVHGHHFGATGIGYWCYNVGESLWEPVEFEYALVYVNPDGTQTSSRRWEAVREGMEDTRILIALREKQTDESISADAKEAIRHLLDVTVAELSEQSLDEARLGVARYVIDDSNNDETVERLREEMMDCVEQNLTP